MKKSTKRLCILGISLCIAGGIMCRIGYFMDDSSISLSNIVSTINSNEEKHLYKLEKTKISDIQSLDFELSTSSFKVESSDDASFYISYHIQSAAKKDPISYEVKQNKLQIKEKELDNYTNIDAENNEVILYVPKNNNLHDIKGNNDVGNINVKDLICNSLNLSADVGNISLTDMEIRKGSSSSDVGNINITNSSLSDFETKTYTGNITASLVSIKNNITMNCDTGKINIHLSDKNTPIQIHAETNLGNIDVSDSLGGTLVKDVTESTYNLESSNPSGTLTLTVGTGNISIQS
ncbi:DUF4097 family beta strand repeat-containing protein [Erysipelotrichaceae bacterium HCN-30851]